METQRHRSTAAGFSLIELLVVIAVVGMLVAVILPGFLIAKERAGRVVCLSNVHQFILGLQVYAEQNKYRLPATGVSSTFELSQSAYDILADSIGDEKAMFCPSLGKPFLDKKSGSPGSWPWQNDHRSIYLGYNYLGGHRNAPWPLVEPATAEWESAVMSSCKTTMPIVTELNNWSVVYDKTVAPHGKRGACRLGDDYMNTGLGGITSGQIGAAGGNIGYIDGSGHWKKIDEENIYRASFANQTARWFATW